MKKLFNSRFLFILAISVVVLILLTLGAFYLFDDEDDVFVKSGYVLNPLSSVSEKYFFDENVGYKENLSSMIEFTDVDENVVSVLKDSFIHYLDDSMSFLKNGAILDLDSVKGDKAVSFYNITNKSVIERADNGYVIESAGGEIRLNNFIGRISDNKYIVAGDISLKIAGNDTTIKGDYFEVVYVEEGIVNIENKSVKYQVAAENTLIYVGNDKVIDLGDKKITVNDADVMSITSITIDGDENIEIIPKGNEEDDEPSGDDGAGEGEGNATTPGEDGQGGSGSGTGTEDGNDGTGGTGNEGIESDDTDDIVISLKDVETGSTNIDVIFDIVNAKEDDVFKLQVVNLSSGKTIDMSKLPNQVEADEKISVNLLTPNTKYLFMVINEKDEVKYFQKVLETTGFGIKLEKNYATSTSLSYKVTIEKGTDITSAKLTLYRFDEDTNTKILVTDSTVENPYSFNLVKENLEGEYNVVFGNLKPDTIYIAVLDEFSIASSNFRDIYNIVLNSMTLKEVPRFGEMTTVKDVGAGSITLSVGNVIDPNNAIVKYTYNIYEKNNPSKEIISIPKNNASPETIYFGDGAGELQNGVEYYYEVVVEYFDNEKYLEYVREDTLDFDMSDDPYVTVVPKEVTHNSVTGTIYLTDNSCLVTLPGRAEKCDGTSQTVFEIYRDNPLTGADEFVDGWVIEKFDTNSDPMKYEFEYLEKLQPGNTYIIKVKTIINGEEVYIDDTEESKEMFTTKSLSSFQVKWENDRSDEVTVVNALMQFLPVESSSNTLSSEDTLEYIDRVVLKIYQGRITDYNGLNKVDPLEIKTYYGTDTYSIKKNFYDNAIGVTTENTFGLDLADLIREAGGEKPQEYYTLVVEAYTAADDQINFIDNSNIYNYRINPTLLGTVPEPIIQITDIVNSQIDNKFANLSYSNTVVGYNIFASFDREGLLDNNLIPQRIHFYVFDNNDIDENTVEKKPLKFYIMDENNELKLVDQITAELGDKNLDDFYETQIYMDYGLAYGESDGILRRGKEFYIGYEIDVTMESDKSQEWAWPTSTDANAPRTTGLYQLVKENKEEPNIKMYIASSDANSITYHYNISDPDNSVYKSSDSENYSFYYYINDGSENSYSLDKVADASFNQFEGDIKITGLKNGDQYKLYYKRDKNIKDDIEDYLDSYSSGIRTFDGKYDLKNNVDRYSFKYSVTSNERLDNKVTIKILASEEVLDRILSYKLTFTADNKEAYIVDMWQLNACDGDREGDAPRCLSVDYSTLSGYDMLGEEITVTVTAYYDTGLTGYDFKTGSEEGSEYPYIIMQDNSSEYGMGNYLSLSSTGADLALWSEELGVAKGYYTYNWRQSGTKTKLNYYSRLIKKGVLFDTTLSSSGWTFETWDDVSGFMTPKMVDYSDMKCTNDNTFTFNSVSPKIRVTQYAPLLDGSVLNLTLSGVDQNVLEGMKKEDGSYYLYVETWDNSADVGKKDANGNIDRKYTARPVERIAIDSSNPTKTVRITLDGLKDNATSYFNVYAYMSVGNGEYDYRQLPDATITNAYVAKTYEFKSAKYSDIYQKFTSKLRTLNKSDNKNYGSRELETNITLGSYKNGIKPNYDLVYIVCNIADAKNCGLGEGNTNIFDKTIEMAAIMSGINTDVEDIYKYNLEYNKNYYMYIYARVKYYAPEYDDAGNPLERKESTRDIVLNATTGISFKLDALEEPTFEVTRVAGNDNGDSYIDFTIGVTDSDRALIDGNYYIKLEEAKGKDENGNTIYEIVGNAQILKGGVYTPISNYQDVPFDATAENTTVRIGGLKTDSGYRFVIYGDAYLNNYDANDLTPDEDIVYVDLPDGLKANEKRIIEASRAYTVYTANDYGVAFGKEITFSATESSIYATFGGGSSLIDNVLEVGYTVVARDDETVAPDSGTYIIGVNHSGFDMYKNTSDWRFEIKPNMKIVEGKTYIVTLSFKVKVPGSDDTAILTSADFPQFEGRVNWFENEE